MKDGLKKYINSKIYLLAKLKTSRKSNSGQDDIDKILENFDEQEPTFKNLDEAKSFLEQHKKSRVVSPSEVVRKENKDRHDEPDFPEKKRFTFGDYFIFVLAAAAIATSFYWKYYR